MADDRAVLLGDERNQRRDGAAQRRDDPRLVGTAEGQLVELAHGRDVGRRFGSDLHGHRR